MPVSRFYIYIVALILTLTAGSYLFAIVGGAQAIDPDIRPDLARVLRTPNTRQDGVGRPEGHRPFKKQPQQMRSNAARPLSRNTARVLTNSENLPATAPITPGTALTSVVHTSQLSLNSAAGTDEQFVDRDNDLIADERTTFDNLGGSFDIAVGQSGARYEVYSATLNSKLIGVLVVALDTNEDYRLDTSSTFNLQRDFALPSAASVVTGRSKAGREFVVVSSSGYYNDANPSDPNNEPSPGVILLVRDPNTGGFDNSLTRELVRVGDNRLYNANALALMPDNDLLIADFHSDELRIIRDSDADGMPDTLEPAPYYSYRFSNDSPLDIAVNSRGVVFSHSAGNDTVMLAIYDDEGDGRGDRDEVIVEGLSLDNNLFLHGLTVDRTGNIYALEDASGEFDGPDGNGGRARIDAFPDPSLNGFPTDGAIFCEADAAVGLALSGLALGATPPNHIDEPQFFVRQQYLDFLSREPDQAGWDYWTSEITLCGRDQSCIRARRIAVANAFFFEPEFQLTGGYVYRVYRAALGLTPSFAQFEPDRAQVIGGANLDQSKATFASNFVQRAAFLDLYPRSLTAAQFVDQIQLNSGADLSAIRDGLIRLYDGTDIGRASILRQVADHPAFVDAEYNRSFVLNEYFGYLRRDPDPMGYSFWLGQVERYPLRDTAVQHAMVCSFITSREYQERFGLMLRTSNADCPQ